MLEFFQPPAKSYPLFDFDYFHKLGDRAFKKLKTLIVFLRSEDYFRKKGLKIIPK